jgi:hypothetical protein
MTKQDIIDQWHEDQKPVNPQALGWVLQTTESPLLRDYYEKPRHELSVEHDIWLLVDVMHDEILIECKISNQGQLRILMEMLNIK